MNEIITDIQAIEDYEIDGNKYEGYRIATTEQEIFLVIDCEGQCCEVWGYFWTNEDATEFLGSELLGISVIDTELDETKLQTIDPSYGGNAMFVNLETSNGILQFVAYNDHNGYYGHYARVISKQFVYREML